MASGLARLLLLLLLVSAVCFGLCWQGPQPPSERLDGYLVFTTLMRKERALRTVAVDLRKRSVVQLPQNFIASKASGDFVLEAAGDPRHLRLIHGDSIRVIRAPNYPGPAMLRRSGTMNERGTFGYWMGPAFVTVDGSTGQVSELHGLPSSAPDVAMAPSGRAAFASLNGKIVRVDLLSRAITPIGEGYAPTVSPAGRLAWITKDHRHVVLMDSLGHAQHKVHWRNARLLSLAWSPDEKHLACLYGLGLGGYASGLSGQYGIGIFDPDTMQGWRLLPVAAQGMSIRVAHPTDGSRLQWLDVLPAAAVSAAKSADRAIVPQ